MNEGLVPDAERRRTFTSVPGATFEVPEMD